jgi:hypothetical protein
MFGLGNYNKLARKLAVHSPSNNGVNLRTKVFALHIIQQFFSAQKVGPKSAWFRMRGVIGQKSTIMIDKFCELCHKSNALTRITLVVFLNYNYENKND